MQLSFRVCGVTDLQKALVLLIDYESHGER
jgi:hypothetical protein